MHDPKIVPREKIKKSKNNSLNIKKGRETLARTRDSYAIKRVCYQ